MPQLAPHTRAALDQMVAATRDYWDGVDVDPRDPSQALAIQATLSAVIWAYQNRRDELGWWLTALCETVNSPLPQ